MQKQAKYLRLSHRSHMHVNNMYVSKSTHICHFKRQKSRQSSRASIEQRVSQNQNWEEEEKETTDRKARKLKLRTEKLASKAKWETGEN